MKNSFWSRLRNLFRLRGNPDFYYVEEQREFEQHLEENKLKRAV